jgi:ADP-heptose:LPS heptosyltransferase
MRDGNKFSAAVAMATLERDLRRRRFEVAIDFHGFLETQLLVGLSGSSVRIGLHRQAKRWIASCFNRPPVVEDKSLHVSDMFLKVAAAAAEEERLPIPVPPLLRAPERLSARLSERKLAGFYTGAGAPDRMWPPNRFAQLADLLVEQNFDILLLGGASAWESGVRREIASQCRHPERVHLPDVLSTAELVGAISQCDVLVSNDTGPMHIGPALGVSTVALFSVGFPEHYRPYGDGHACVQAPTMEAISTDQVFTNVRQICESLINGPRT